VVTNAGVATPSASPSPTVHTVGEVYSTEGVEPFVYGEPLGSLTGKADPKNKYGISREGWRIDLMGVYRLAPDRVLVELRLNGDDAKSTLDALSDPDFDFKSHLTDPDAGTFHGVVDEVSDVSLTVAGDDAKYLPVRMKNNYCLCTMKGIIQKGRGDFPAYVVMAAPAGASQVTLSIPHAGAFKDIAVADSMPQRDVVPLDEQTQMRLVSLERSGPGALTARLALERTDPSGTSWPFDLRGLSPWDSTMSKAPTAMKFKNVFALTPDGVWGGLEADSMCPSCTEGKKLAGLEGIEVEVTVPDPGTDELMFGATTSWLLSARNVPGAASKAPKNVFEYYPRMQAPGIDVGQNINLDTTVLFATDKATLTSAAGKVLDKAVKILQAQDGRSLSVVGHTDSTGTSAHNLDLSKRRAQAVKDALASRLGAGWSFTVKGVGETQPRVKESGLSGAKLDRARALNRRVEISVAK